MMWMVLGNWGHQGFNFWGAYDAAHGADRATFTVHLQRECSCDFSTVRAAQHEGGEKIYIILHSRILRSPDEMESPASASPDFLSCTAYSTQEE